MGVLKSIFGPSKKEAWTQVAEEIGAEYVKESFWKNGKLKLKHKVWTIVLDTVQNDNSEDCTRIRASFINRDDFYFSIYRQGVFALIGKFFWNAGHSHW